MSRIHFTEYYIKAITSVLKIISNLETNKEVLFFKDNTESYFSKMNSNIWVNLRTETDNVKFDDPEIGIENLDEFLKYLKQSEYPVNAKAKIETKVSKTSFGTEYETFEINGKGIKYFLPRLNGLRFKQPYDRKVPVTREQDALQKVATINMSKKEIKFMCENKKLLSIGKDDTFGLRIVDGIVDMTMKSVMNRQFDYTFDDTNDVDQNYTTITGTATHKLFNSSLFDYMNNFACDFEIELRYSVSHDVLAVKAYGIVPKGANVTTSNINVLVGTQESKAQQISNHFEIFV